MSHPINENTTRLVIGTYIGKCKSTQSCRISWTAETDGTLLNIIYTKSLFTDAVGVDVTSERKYS